MHWQTHAKLVKQKRFSIVSEIELEEIGDERPMPFENLINVEDFKEKISILKSKIETSALSSQEKEQLNHIISRIEARDYSMAYISKTNLNLFRSILNNE